MRFLVYMFVCMVVSGIVSAQENTEELTYNPFGIPNQIVKVIEAPKVEDNQTNGVVANFPACNDDGMLQQIKTLLDENNKTEGDESIIERRTRLLALKNTKNFSPFDLKTMRPQDNYEIANIMIAAKINQGLKDDDFRACVSDNKILNKQVFLLMQAIGDDIKVTIINYLYKQSPSFIYKK